MKLRLPQGTRRKHSSFIRVHHDHPGVATYDQHCEKKAWMKKTMIKDTREDVQYSRVTADMGSSRSQKTLIKPRTMVAANGNPRCQPCLDHCREKHFGTSWQPPPTLQGGRRRNNMSAETAVKPERYGILDRKRRCTEFAADVPRMLCTWRNV